MRRSSLQRATKQNIPLLTLLTKWFLMCFQEKTKCICFLDTISKQMNTTVQIRQSWKQCFLIISTWTLRIKNNQRHVEFSDLSHIINVFIEFSNTDTQQLASWLHNQTMFCSMQNRIWMNVMFSSLITLLWIHTDLVRHVYFTGYILTLIHPTSRHVHLVTSLLLWMLRLNCLLNRH